MGPAKTGGEGLYKDGEPQIERGVLSAKADELDERIRELTALRDGLRHAAACPAIAWSCAAVRRSSVG